MTAGPALIIKSAFKDSKSVAGALALFSGLAFHSHPAFAQQNLVTGQILQGYGADATLSAGAVAFSATNYMFGSNVFALNVNNTYILTYSTTSNAYGVIYLVSYPINNSSVMFLNDATRPLSATASSRITPADFAASYISNDNYILYIETDGSNVTLSNLSFSIAGPSVINTSMALVASQNALGSLLNQRTSAIAATMDYDCVSFDAKGYCVSFRARYTGMDSQNEGAGILTAAYLVNADLRIGGFIDYRTSQREAAGLKQGDTMPTFGVFAAYSERGDATGLQVKASAAYNRGKVAITRFGSVADNTEAGSGKTDLNSYAIGAELGWGFAVSPAMLVAPYAGVRYTDATRDGYAERTIDGVVDYPVTYNAYYQRLTTATAGVRLAGMFSEKVGYQASFGGEYDLAHKANAYSGASTISGLEMFAFANTASASRARAVASTGLYYQLDKTQRLTAAVSVRGQAYSSQPSVTTLVGYQVAF